MPLEPSMNLEDPALAYPQHECGIFAVFGHDNAAVLAYYGLFALQHRGQESAGIVTSKGPGSTFQLHRDMGLVSQVFGADELERLKGTRALGHARYSTTGSSTLKTRSRSWSIVSGGRSRSPTTAI
jgi:amidophosphoribosyltransferase